MTTGRRSPYSWDPRGPRHFPSFQNCRQKRPAGLCPPSSRQWRRSWAWLLPKMLGHHPCLEKLRLSGSWRSSAMVWPCHWANTRPSRTVSTSTASGCPPCCPSQRPASPRRSWRNRISSVGEFCNICITSLFQGKRTVVSLFWVIQLLFCLPFIRTTGILYRLSIQFRFFHIIWHFGKAKWKRLGKMNNILVELKKTHFTVRKKNCWHSCFIAIANQCKFWFFATFIFMFFYEIWNIVIIC